MKNVVTGKYSSEMKPLDWIYPSYLRDNSTSPQAKKDGLFIMLSQDFTR